MIVACLVYDSCMFIFFSKFKFDKFNVKTHFTTGFSCWMRIRSCHYNQRLGLTVVCWKHPFKYFQKIIHNQNQWSVTLWSSQVPIWFLLLYTMNRVFGALPKLPPLELPGNRSSPRTGSRAYCCPNTGCTHFHFDTKIEALTRCCCCCCCCWWWRWWWWWWWWGWGWWWLCPAGAGLFSFWMVVEIWRWVNSYSKLVYKWFDGL